MAAIEKRVQFDFEIEFLNGGGIQGQDFRLDIAGADIDDQALADYIVRDLRLLMVGRVRILNKRILIEPHKRSAAAAAKTAPAGRFVDLSRAGDEGTRTCIDTPPGTAIALPAVSNVDAVIVRVTGMAERAIPREAFAAHDVAGKAVLVHTGWDIRGHFLDAPFLTAGAAHYLREARAALIGIDSSHIDDVDDPQRPAHAALLAAGIPIVRHLRGLSQLHTSGFHFFAVPPQSTTTGTSAVRAYALLPE